MKSVLLIIATEVRINPVVCMLEYQLMTGDSNPRQDRKNILLFNLLHLRNSSVTRVHYTYIVDGKMSL